MRLDYRVTIQEPLDELEQLERQYRGSKVGPRVQMLRLLKSGQAKTQPDCARLLGFSLSGIESWWQTYKRDGLSALLEMPHYAGKPSQITQQAWEALKAKMEAGEIATLEQARQYLNQQWGTHYQSVNGIHWQFKRFKVKLKTGRPRHRRAEPQAQADFKKLSKRYAER